MLAKQLNIGNPAHLEKRIRKELEEQGETNFKKILKLYIRKHFNVQNAQS